MVFRRTDAWKDRVATRASSRSRTGMPGRPSSGRVGRASARLVQDRDILDPHSLEHIRPNARLSPRQSRRRSATSTRSGSSEPSPAQASNSQRRRSWHTHPRSSQRRALSATQAGVAQGTVCRWLSGPRNGRHLSKDCEAVGRSCSRRFDCCPPRLGWCGVLCAPCQPERTSSGLRFRAFDPLPRDP